MNPITNDRDYRVGYEILSILTSADRKRSGDPKKLEQHITETKRNLRRYAHREIDYNQRIIHDDGMDGYVAVVRLPDDIRDLDEAKRFFEEFMTFHYRPSAYDCTGQAMTNWFKAFPRNGGFYAYHSVSFDV